MKKVFLLLVIVFFVFGSSKAQSPFQDPTIEPVSGTPPVIWMQYMEIGGVWLWLPFFNV